MRLLLGLALCLAATTAVAGVTSLYAITANGPDTPPGFVTNDLFIDFKGDLRGQQMIVVLTAGTIYQDVFGSDTTPSGALFPSFPTTEFDTFVTMGGPTTGSSERLILVGGSPNLPGDATQRFDENGINIAWAPATGVNIPQGVAFQTARLTLSDDAFGHLWYFGSTRGDDDPLVAAPGGNHPFGSIWEGRLFGGFGATPGDFSGDWRIDNADLTLLLDNWGAPAVPLPQGWDGYAPNGPRIDNEELTDLLDSWASIAAVPEPGSLALLAVAYFGLRLRRRDIRSPTGSSERWQGSRELV